MSGLLFVTCEELRRKFTSDCTLKRYGIANKPAVGERVAARVKPLITTIHTMKIPSSITLNIPPSGRAYAGGQTNR